MSYLCTYRLSCRVCHCWMSGILYKPGFMGYYPTEHMQMVFFVKTTLHMWTTKSSFTSGKMSEMLINTIVFAIAMRIHFNSFHILLSVRRSQCPRTHKYDFHCRWSSTIDIWSSKNKIVCEQQFGYFNRHQRSVPRKTSLFSNRNEVDCGWWCMHIRFCLW